ncbi:MAG TPA: hypothetical protein VEL76_05675 [Gemmataceae bacterium]|nr:hypothetical protein [Gemmataceae bacterium]
MRRAQVVIYENDGRLTGLLRERATACGWWLREVHHAGACLRLLRRGGVLVLKVGRDVERELTLLERATRLCPDAVAVLVGDADNPALAGLAWDLGARYVLFPPQPREHLPDIVSALMSPADSPPTEGPP